MKNKLFKRAAALLLALVCVVGALPPPASAAGEVSGYGITRALCAYHQGRLGSPANGQNGK